MHIEGPEKRVNKCGIGTQALNNLSVFDFRDGLNIFQKKKKEGLNSAN